MLYGMYLSAAGAIVEETRQAVIANNIANASTPGYKADTAVFRQRLTEAEKTLEAARGGGWDGQTGGVFLDRVEYTRSRGPFIPTGQPLDMALKGDGFFTVTDGTQVLYTRAGNFARSPDGYLVTANGWKVLGTDGKPIRLPPGEVKVGTDGALRVGGRPAGKILVAGSLDPAQFEKVGENTFRYLGTGSPAPVKAEVLQGFLENSSVGTVGELTSLIGSQRAYEANLQMARIQDESLGRATNELGRVVMA
jgi:flagellar basal-body rod protein FlgF